MPPRTISEFYEIFVDQETERLHIVSRAEGIRAQLITKGKHKVLESAANMVFLYVCEQSLLTIELELIESFEALLQVFCATTILLLAWPVFKIVEEIVAMVHVDARCRGCL
eukprot:COSAG05_NODE_222_length_13641_cov_73.452001_2_plen_111_part_00